MNQLQDYYMNSGKKTNSNFHEQIEGQKSINDKLLTLFENEKTKNCTLIQDKQELTTRINELEGTIKSSGELMRQFSGH